MRQQLSVLLQEQQHKPLAVTRTSSNDGSIVGESYCCRNSEEPQEELNTCNSSLLQAQQETTVCTPESLQQRPGESLASNVSVSLDAPTGTTYSNSPQQQMKVEQSETSTLAEVQQLDEQQQQLLREHLQQEAERQLLRQHLDDQQQQADQELHLHHLQQQQFLRQQLQEHEQQQQDAVRLYQAAAASPGLDVRSDLSSALLLQHQLLLQQQLQKQKQMMQHDDSMKTLFQQQQLGLPMQQVSAAQQMDHQQQRGALPKVVGVRFDKVNKTWRASWYDPETKRRVERKFSVNKLGFYQAYRQATECRQLQEQQLGLRDRSVRRSASGKSAAAAAAAAAACNVPCGLMDPSSTSAASGVFKFPGVMSALGGTDLRRGSASELLQGTNQPQQQSESAGVVGGDDEPVVNVADNDDLEGGGGSMALNDEGRGAGQRHSTRRRRVASKAATETAVKRSKRGGRSASASVSALDADLFTCGGVGAAVAAAACGNGGNFLGGNTECMDAPVNSLLDAYIRGDAYAGMSFIGAVGENMVGSADHGNHAEATSAVGSWMNPRFHDIQMQQQLMLDGGGVAAPVSVGRTPLHQGGGCDISLKDSSCNREAVSASNGSILSHDSMIQKSLPLSVSGRSLSGGGDDIQNVSGFMSEALGHEDLLNPYFPSASPFSSLLELAAGRQCTGGPSGLGVGADAYNSGTYLGGVGLIPDSMNPAAAQFSRAGIPSSSATASMTMGTGIPGFCLGPGIAAAQSFKVEGGGGAAADSLALYKEILIFLQFSLRNFLETSLSAAAAGIPPIGSGGAGGYSTAAAAAAAAFGSPGNYLGVYHPPPASFLSEILCSLESHILFVLHATKLRDLSLYINLFYSCIQKKMLLQQLPHAQLMKVLKVLLLNKPNFSNIADFADIVDSGSCESAAMTEEAIQIKNSGGLNDAPLKTEACINNADESTVTCVDVSAVTTGVDALASDTADLDLSATITRNVDASATVHTSLDQSAEVTTSNLESSAVTGVVDTSRGIANVDTLAADDSVDGLSREVRNVDLSAVANSVDSTFRGDAKVDTLKVSKDEMDNLVGVESIDGTTVAKSVNVASSGYPNVGISNVTDGVGDITSRGALTVITPSFACVNASTMANSVDTSTVDCGGDASSSYRNSTSSPSIPVSITLDGGASSSYRNSGKLTLDDDVDVLAEDNQHNKEHSTGREISLEKKGNKCLSGDSSNVSLGSSEFLKSSAVEMDSFMCPSDACKIKPGDIKGEVHLDQRANCTVETSSALILIDKAIQNADVKESPDRTGTVETSDVYKPSVLSGQDNPAGAALSVGDEQGSNNKDRVHSNSFLSNETENSECLNEHHTNEQQRSDDCLSLLIKQGEKALVQTFSELKEEEKDPKAWSVGNTTCSLDDGDVKKLESGANVPSDPVDGPKNPDKLVELLL